MAAPRRSFPGKGLSSCGPDHVPCQASADGAPMPATASGAGQRRFDVYEPLAAFELLDELEFLTQRAIEPVPFYAPQFLVPAMPRLDDRHVRLMVARDEKDGRSRLRLLMPFSVERSGLLGGPSCVRAWTHPFGPRGGPPIDHDDPAGTVASLFDTLREPRMKLPPILVAPDLRLDGPVATTLLAEAARRGLPVRIVERRERACLSAEGDAERFLPSALSARRQRELSRQRRRLEARGRVGFTVASKRQQVREAAEIFLELEASGWKGRARSALLNDRYRAAFAREALDGLAELQRVRVYTLTLDGRAIASAILLVTGGEAALWKIAYDEAAADVSPGFQLLAKASQAMLRDPAIRFVDSCAVPDHSLVNRLWRDRIEIGTLVIGLHPDAQRAVARASAGVTRTRRAREGLWRVRSLLKRLRLRR